jgi:AcrR family transcriptional regulator
MAKIKRNRNGTRKDVIITKAAKLFREKGFSATSMRDLAEHVGVEAASLYNHISSKAELLQEICFKVANNFLTHIEEVDASNKGSIAKIEAILRFHIKQII